MPVQDDVRERQMRDRFNLSIEPDRMRSDIDAYLILDGRKINFELKSTTSGSVSTVRDFGPDHIAKWRDGLHWVFAFYDRSGNNLLYCIYASPADMEPWIAEKESYIATDFALADDLPSFVSEAQVVSMLGQKSVYSRADARRIMKAQWSASDYASAEDREAGYSRRRMAEILAKSRDEEFSSGLENAVIARFGSSESYSVEQARTLMGRRWRAWEYRDEQDLEAGYSLDRMTEMLQERARYVISRGSTLNNPHIEASYFPRFERITDEPAAKLRALVGDYLEASATDEATA